MQTPLTHPTESVTQDLPVPSAPPILGILVGGGPAPGINGVISAATLSALDRGWKVYGFLDGFQHLMEGTEKLHNYVIELTKSMVTQIPLTAGSILRTSRANPTRGDFSITQCIENLCHYRIRYLITIGGNDTAFASHLIRDMAPPETFTMVHLPKTIDNDMFLHTSVPTLGFRTAHAVGHQIVRNLVQDARCCPPRFYVVVAQGRHVGHLALGIAKSTGAHLALIPEEWEGRQVHFQEICDHVDGMVLKRLAQGKEYGVAVLAEGLVDLMPLDEIEAVFQAQVRRDEAGYIRMNELELGFQVQEELKRRFFKRCCSQPKFFYKNIGFEARSAEPNPYDAEYAKDLGFSAISVLAHGGDRQVLCVSGQKLTQIPFAEMIDPDTQRLKIRGVDIEAMHFQVACYCMCRLKQSDKHRPELITAMARMVGDTDGAVTPADRALVDEEFLERYDGIFVGDIFR